MAFNITSFWFFAFLALSLLIYYIFPRKIQWVWLLIASLGFVYLSVGFAAFPFLFVDILAIYFGSRAIEKAKTAASKRRLLLATLFVIIGQLFVLKYYNNMAVWVDRLLMLSGGLHMPAWRVSWIAPIGISYFSLSAIGYVLDVYWETQKAERNPFKLALLVAWFPALVSGPIVKYREQSEKLFASHRFSYLSLKFGFERVLWGLFKKMVIADRISIMTSVIFADTATYSGFYIAIAVIMYAFLIYCDFSGCIDIVLGVSEMFQIPMPENFQRPFFSKNLSEFWRRWHISLGVWAKEYVMYPLLKSEPFRKLGKKSKKTFGKKLGKNIPTYIGMLVLWIVIGFWHGGSPKYIFASGILPWVFIVGGQLMQPLFDKIVKVFRIKTDCFSYRLFSMLRTLMLMCFVWLFIATPGITPGFSTLKHMLTGLNPSVLFDGSIISSFGLGLTDFALLVVCFVVVLVVSLLQERGVAIRRKLEEQNIVFQWAIIFAGVFAVMIFGVYGPGYNPVNFIYAGF